MDALTPYLLVLAIPVGLLILYVLFRWRYTVAIRKTILSPADAATEPAAGTISSGNVRPLAFTWMDAAADRSARSRELSAALMITAEMKRRFLIAGAVFLSVAFAVVLAGQRSVFGPAQAVSLAYSTTLPSLFVIAAFQGLRVRGWIVAAVAWGAGGFVLLVAPLGVPLHLAPSALLGGVDYASLALAAVALMILPTTKAVVVGFLPLVGIWLGFSALFALLLVTFGMSLDQIDQAWSAGIVAVGLVAIVVGFAAAVREIRRGVRGWFVLALVSTLAIGVGIGFARPNFVAAFVSGAALNALLIVCIWYVFERFLRLKARGTLPDDVLHYSFCWLGLTALLPAYSASSVAAIPWWLLPIAAYAVVLALLLRNWRRRLTGREPKQLLLLRAFGRGPLRARLLDLLDDSWRRIGTIEVVVGVDLAARTLSAAALENFLLGRVARQFIRSGADVERCLMSLPRDLAVDGRYPLNELHCVPGIWQKVVRRIALEADVVLMDLRGFQATNRGVIFELSLIISRVLLSRVVLLVDRTTDERALTEAMLGAWSQVPDDSPNVLGEPTVLLIRCAGKQFLDAPALLNHVFRAAAIADPSRSDVVPALRPSY